MVYSVGAAKTGGRERARKEGGRREGKEGGKEGRREGGREGGRGRGIGSQRCTPPSTDTMRHCASVSDC